MNKETIMLPDDQDPTEQSEEMKSHAIEELVNVYGYEADQLNGEIIEAYLQGAQLALGKVAMAMDSHPFLEAPSNMIWTGCFVGEKGVRFWLEGN
jgi:hypothetical protein